MNFFLRSILFSFCLFFSVCLYASKKMSIIIKKTHLESSLHLKSLDTILRLPPFSAQIARLDWTDLRIRHHAVTVTQDIEIEVKGVRYLSSHSSPKISILPANVWMEWATFESKLLFRQSVQKLAKHHFDLPSPPELRLYNQQSRLALEFYHPTGVKLVASVPAAPRNQLLSAEFFEVEGAPSGAMGFLSLREKSQDGALTQRLVWVHYTDTDNFQFTETQPLPFNLPEENRRFF
jgi:hypothetical protein